METCSECEQVWHKPHSVRCWYIDYQSWVAKGECSQHPNPASNEVTIPTDKFYSCFVPWLQTDEGTFWAKNIAFKTDNSIKGWRQYAEPINIYPEAEAGPQYLKDIRAIEDKYGIDGTEIYSYSNEMLDYE